MEKDNDDKIVDLEIKIKKSEGEVDNLEDSQIQNGKNIKSAEKDLKRTQNKDKIENLKEVIKLNKDSNKKISKEVINHLNLISNANAQISNLVELECQKRRRVRV